MGNRAAQGLYPQKDENDPTSGEKGATSSATPVEESGKGPELHGQHVPPCSHGLEYSSRVRSEELPSP